MSSPRPQASYDLSRFGELLAAIEDAGFDVCVIGGIAVGAYGRLCGLPVVSADLDLFLAPRMMDDFLDWASGAGLTLVYRPQPRALQSAVLDWGGITIDVLSESAGLPSPELVAARAREFVLAGRDGLVVAVADPFDLLANKLAIGREKDLAHIELLRRFVEEEVLVSFKEETGRRRLAAARRLMEVLGTTTLPRSLAERMLPAARDGLGRRFLVGCVPGTDLADALVAAADDAAERTHLTGLRARRGLDDP
jgi:hypothetical protein